MLDALQNKLELVIPASERFGAKRSQVATWGVAGRVVRKARDTAVGLSDCSSEGNAHMSRSRKILLKLKLN